jgi:hypothetical protein
MWTPRRLLLVVLGLFLFGTSYGVYGYFLGRVDGLPELPEEYWPDDTGIPPPPPPPATTSPVDSKLIQAFGVDCDEVKKRTIKLEIRSRGLVLAADQFTIEHDGRVQFRPFSVAIFGKDHGDGAFPEINTVRSDVAYLEFDHPITSLTDMGKYKIIGGELIGNVLAVNNRRRPQHDEDLSLFTQGPMFYKEELHLIWTDKDVDVQDVQSKPQPMRITATGMRVHLTDDTHPPPAGHAASRKKVENISGVELVELRSDVTMNLFVDSHSGFLGTGSEQSAAEGKPPAGNAERPGTVTPLPPLQKNPWDHPAQAATEFVGPPAPPSQVEKTRIVIQTQGPFHYDVIHDHAEFWISQHPGPHPNRVEVTRLQELGKRDVLDCEHLELQFRRKGATAGPAGPAAPVAATREDRSVELEIEHAHATGRLVMVASDSEGLTAFGNDLVHNARTRLSILKGDQEMVAMKDGNEIHARELHLCGADRKNDQTATAIGPGWIDMLDSTQGERTVHAQWEKELVWAKDGPYDLLTLTGHASFEEKAPSPKTGMPDPATPKGPPVQKLDADCLKVWIEPAENSHPDNGDKHRRPHHLEATGNVQARSPDMIVHDSEHMLVWFRDGTPAGGTPPEAPEGKPGATNAPASPGSRPADNPGAAGTPDGPAGPASGDAKPGAPPEKPKKPIDLRARSVEAFVLRFGNRNELDKLRCEGGVHVLQDPATPDEKGVDIRGETLQLKRFPTGNFLVVTADQSKGQKELAYVQLDKITIIGPEVNIDQVENKAWVTGIGSMKMPSNTNFEGKKLEQPKELTVHWNESMLFTGKYADFRGGVQAEMEPAEPEKLSPHAEREVSRLACQTLQVFLDREVSLRQGEKEKDTKPARVDQLVCDKQVRTEETTWLGRQLRDYKRIVCTELSVDNREGLVSAPGAGVVYLLQLGTKDEAAPGAPSASQPALVGPQPEQELKLTRVTYAGRMFANNNTHTAIFNDNVEVVHLPSDNPDMTIDLTKPPPPGGMYLRCEQLKVRSVRHPDGTTSHQEMEAHRRVIVQSQEFWGRADVVTYDESKELVIFEGRDGNMATLYRKKVVGGEMDEIKSKKIYYWRRTNTFKTEGTEKLNAITN